jgi:hypothetical protein
MKEDEKMADGRQLGEFADPQMKRAVPEPGGSKVCRF